MAAVTPLSLSPSLPQPPSPADGGPLSLGLWCPPPLLDEKSFPPKHGNVVGRVCGNWSTISGATCCLPCPATGWIYPDRSFAPARALATFSFVLCLILLLSYLLLPKTHSHRHHLPVGLAATLAVVSLAFTIGGPDKPASNPNTCYDPVTPADIYSAPSASCGTSAIFFQFGALASGIWFLLAAVHFHVTVFWSRTVEKKLGRTFLIFTMFCGIMFPIILIGITIAVSGYSQKGRVECGVQPGRSGAVLWGWLVSFSVVGLSLMTFTLVYSAVTYVRHHYGAGAAQAQDVERPRGSQVAQWARVKAILQKDWRGITVGVLLPLEVLIAASILWSQDTKAAGLAKNPKTETFARCLIQQQGRPERCKKEAEVLLVSASGVMFAVVITTLLGLQLALFLLTRSSIYKTWLHVLRHPIDTLVHKDFPPLRPRPASGTNFRNSTQSTFRNSKDLELSVYKVEQQPQPVGSLRQLRRPSLSRRMRSSSSAVQTLDDLRSGVPSPVMEESLSGTVSPRTQSPLGGVPMGGSYYTHPPITSIPNPYEQTNISNRFSQQVPVVAAPVAALINPYGYPEDLRPSRTSTPLQTPPLRSLTDSPFNSAAALHKHRVSRTSTPVHQGEVEAERPVSPVSPIDGRASWLSGNSTGITVVERSTPVNSGPPSRSVSPNAGSSAAPMATANFKGTQPSPSTSSPLSAFRFDIEPLTFNSAASKNVEAAPKSAPLPNSPATPTGEDHHPGSRAGWRRFSIIEGPTTPESAPQADKQRWRNYSIAEPSRTLSGSFKDRKSVLGRPASLVRGHSERSTPGKPQGWEEDHTAAEGNPLKMNAVEPFASRRMSHA